MVLVDIQQFDVFLVNLDPTQGSEIRKTRPCLVVSPNEMHTFVRTVIVAPMTRTVKNYPTRVSVTFADKEGQIVLDQIRTVDKSRLVKKIGRIETRTAKAVLQILTEMFA